MSSCLKCNKTLSTDEVGLYKKMISRMAEDFLCKECLAEKIGCSVGYLDKKIARFKQDGCLLFDLSQK